MTTVSPSSPNFDENDKMDGWIILCGILGGSTLFISFIWNVAKLWFKNAERESSKNPPTITYLTENKILSNKPEGNRLAEVPLESKWTKYIL